MDNPGYVQPTFFEDFYNRVHVSPTQVELEGVYATQTREVCLWSAYPDSVELESIFLSDQPGLSLSPVELPGTLGPLGSIKFDLTISEIGPTLIDSEYVFNLSTESATLKVVGQRLVLWHFCPEVGFKEELAWNTNVIKSYSSEQRFALRSEPHQTLTYDFTLSPKEFRLAKSMSSGWAERVYLVPLWAETTYVGNLAAGSPEIAIETSRVSFKQDGLFLLSDAQGNFLALRNSSVLEDRILLQEPLSKDFHGGYVCPVRLARSPNGVSFTRNAFDEVLVRAEFEVQETFTPPEHVVSLEYRGRPVNLSPQVLVSELREEVLRSLERVENGSNYPIFEKNSSQLTRRGLIMADSLSVAETQAQRSWLWSLVGQQKTFWQPSWNGDMVVTRNLSEGATALAIESINFGFHYQTKDVMLRTKSGTTHLMRCTGASPLGLCEELVNFTPPLLEPVNADDVEICCFIEHVRLETDVINIQHRSSRGSSFTATTLEVEED